jgi:hypothetical protein
MIPSGISPHSTYFKFIEAEHEQILKNKWYISERLGKDCGMDYAVWDWSMRQRNIWIKELRACGLYPIY